MALIPCPECGYKISNHAHTCPSCGFPFKELFSSQRGYYVLDGPNENNIFNNSESDNNIRK